MTDPRFEIKTSCPRELSIYYVISIPSTILMYYESLCPLLTRVYTVCFLPWLLYTLSKILWTVKSVVTTELQSLEMIFITPSYQRRIQRSQGTSPRLLSWSMTELDQIQVWTHHPGLLSLPLLSCEPSLESCLMCTRRWAVSMMGTAREACLSSASTAQDAC